MVLARDAPSPPTRADHVLVEALIREISAEVPRGFAGSVLVARHDEVLLNEGFGAEKGFPIRADTKFWIASAAKQFTSTAILLCQQKGLLSLEEPISKFFPSAPADKRSITIEQLLTHSSGLPQSYVSESAKDRDAAVSAILAEPLVDRPAAKFHYSNNNYQVAAAILEVVTGRAYSEVVRTQLWSVAHLRSTGFSGDSGAGTVAHARLATPARLTRSSWGAEGVYSTTADLFGWYRSLSSGRVISRQSFARLTRPLVEISEGRSALGWFVGKNALGTQFIFTRGNEDFGPNSLLYAYPKEDVVIVVLTHAGSADGNLSWSRLVHAKLERVLHLNAPPPHSERPD